MKATIDQRAGVFESILMLDGRLPERVRHLRRLGHSASAVYGFELPPTLGRELDALAPRPRARVRVSVWPDAGSLDFKLDLVTDPPRRNVALALIPVTVDGGLGCHKWRDRSWLEEQRRQHGCGPESELLLLDSDGEVLETERAAVLLVEVGSLVVAPDDARRLPSLTRRRAIAAAEEAGLQVKVETISFERLLAADQVLAASSIRQVAAAGRCGTRRWEAASDTQSATGGLPFWMRLR